MACRPATPTPMMKMRAAGMVPAAGLDRDLGAEPDIFLHRLRRRGDAGLARIGFGRDGDTHQSLRKRRQTATSGPKWGLEDQSVRKARMMRMTMQWIAPHFISM